MKSQTYPKVENEVNASNKPNSPVIDVRAAEKLYRGKHGSVQALSPTSFQVEQGEFVSLVGPSGCGKSTMLMLIAGLLPLSAGSIIVNGAPVEKPVTDLGIVFQQDLLMEWRTALDNVLLQGEIRRISKKKLRKRALELLDMVGLSGFENKHPYELSGGMRQRVGICRALVHDPPLLMMDEPFGALDALTRDQMNLDLQALWHGTGKTVVFITHSIAEAIFLGDRVLVFGPRPGRIVDDIRVDLPRPRRMSMRASDEFGELTARVRRQFEAMGLLRDDLAESMSTPVDHSAGQEM